MSSEPRVIETDDRLRTTEQLADAAGVSVDEVRRDIFGPLARAVVPVHHVCATEFARLAGVEVKEVLDAAECELAPAITASKRIDVGHSAALAFFAARPFKRARNGDPIAPDGFLASASVGEDIDIDAPHARAWLARLHGRVPTEAQMNAWLAGAERA